MPSTSRERKTTGRFAVLLNTNAQRVDARVTRRVGELVEPGDVYVSGTPEEASQVVRAISNGGYDTVFTCGGDGTVTDFINRYAEGVEDSPKLGILSFGAGNAMSQMVSSGDPLSDLRQFIANPSSDTTSLPLCQAEGTRFAFASLGLDAQVLADYQRLHAGFGRMSGGVENLGGYIAAAVGLTLPRLVARSVLRRSLKVRVTNLGQSAFKIERTADGGGSVGQPVGPGEVLYEGPANRTVFGTCPFYGFGVAALPFAGLDRDRFHLRVSNVHPARMLLGLRGLWKGTFQHSALHDFHVERVHLEFNEPVPYMCAGEVQGLRRSMTIGMSERSVDLVRFL